ncbi:hypothetical protein TRFO_29111 [Tritrichomonas foetus]|uniref:Glycosyltransferase 61 catalytic domain-containing protein n=1 Tax=Tritrichomonas foetus TaxID=1144522 RepID=A0A1J4JWX9_9EUKA|nr:hypothetical protein TRFO_29111 [Tritrichomonas foetus]|eukprot:OHT03507.1 hypothetical protein TRFO_29111 [Tritrichomonas foetus]
MNAHRKKIERTIFYAFNSFLINPVKSRLRDHIETITSFFSFGHFICQLPLNTTSLGHLDLEISHNTTHTSLEDKIYGIPLPTQQKWTQMLKSKEFDIYLIIEKNKFLLSRASILTPKNLYIFRSLYYARAQDYFRVNRCQEIVTYNKVISFHHDVSSINYGHFLHDVFPKLVFLHQIIPFDQFYFMTDISKPSKFTLFSLDFFHFLSIKKENYIFGQNRIIFGKTIYIISSDFSHYPNPYLLHLMVNFISKNFIAKTSRYVCCINKENGPGDRKFGNFNEIVLYLVKQKIDFLNFPKIHQLSIYSQISFFSKIKVLIGVHGAHMMNSIFMNKNS